jgi:hypothetical protein
MQLFRPALAIGCLLFTPATTLGQSVDSQSRTPSIGERRAEPLLEQALRLSMPLVATQALEQRSGNEQAQARQGRRRTPARRIFGAIVGGAGGFFAGGYTGAWIEGDRCHCDDPGLKGALIGAPVGAALGGVLGGFFLF